MARGGRPGANAQAGNRLTLAIGTVMNARDGMMGLDGPGIGLFVRATRDEQYAGVWVPIGRVYDGRGYFCLQRVATSDAT